MIVYTIGYEGKSIDEFIDELTDHKVELVADVRELPLSRKPGFSKNGLATALNEHDVEYAHFRALGTPRAMRRQLKDEGDYKNFFAEYDTHLTAQQEAYDELVNIARQKAVCLLCFEHDHRRCHRTVLATKLAAEGFRVQHI